MYDIEYWKRWDATRNLCRTYESASVPHDFLNLTISPLNYYANFAKKIREPLIADKVNKFEFLEQPVTSFTRRITSICWHPKYPYTYAVGSKFGDITVGSMDKNLHNTDDTEWKSKQKVEIEGSGPGGSITGMLFHETNPTILYRTSIDSTVSRVDLAHSSNTLKYHDFDNYQEWFTALDVDFKAKILISGDNKGNVWIFNLEDGKQLQKHHLHKAKIHQIEISKKDPNIFVTAGTSESKDASVKIWDIRKLNLKRPVATLPHNCGVNIAKFNPLDGSRLLTSDQDKEIRVYQCYNGVAFGEPLIIDHHHKQFQHITPIKADWHPLSDLIVIGKYPKTIVTFNQDGSKNKKPAGIHRTVEFFNADSGKLMGEIRPPQDKIVSLNVFNPTGELLASGMNTDLIMATASPPVNNYSVLEDSEDPKPFSKMSQGSQGGMSQQLRDVLRGRNNGSQETRKRTRGRQAREYSPASDEEENDKKKKSRKVASKTKKK